MSLTMPFSIRTLPPSFTSNCKMPWKIKKLASVTTNEGMPSLATNVPVHRPRAIATAADNATHSSSGQSSCNRSASTAAATPAVYPAARSISPSRSTNVTAIAITITAAACSRKLARLSADRKLSGRAMPNTATSTTIARIAGSDPRSPVFIRVRKSRSMLPRPWRLLSRAKSLRASPGFGSALTG